MDYHSDDEDDKSIEISLDSSGNEDQPAVYASENNSRIKHRHIEFSKQNKDMYLNTIACPLSEESSDSEIEELPSFEAESPSFTNKSLSQVNQRNIEGSEQR